jgi:hypothetical protein
LLLSPFFIDAVEEEEERTGTGTGFTDEDIAEGNENPDTTGATNEGAIPAITGEEVEDDEDEEAVVEAEGKNENPTGDASLPDEEAAGAAGAATGKENPTAAAGLVPATVEGNA